MKRRFSNFFDDEIVMRKSKFNVKERVLIVENKRMEEAFSFLPLVCKKESRKRKGERKIVIGHIKTIVIMSLDGTKLYLDHKNE